MRIGITTDLRLSMFSAGHPNACLSVAEAFKDHDVIFLHQQEGRDWWDDVQSLKANVPKRVLVADFLKDLSLKPLDLLIEVAFFVSPLMRPRLANHCVWYNRKPGLFTDLEASVYGCKPEGRDLEGISAIWTANCFTTEEDIVYLQTLYPKIPVSLIPWIWTPAIVEFHRNELKSPVWLNNYEASADAKGWSFHVAESNTTNTSSSVLPLVIIKNAIESRPFPLSSVHLHNTDLLKKNTFFKENILEHTQVPDISYNLVGRQRCIDWVYDPKSVIISHNRFIYTKAANLEAAWVGIPIVHNNEFLKSIGHGLEQLYYKSNSVTGAAQAIHKIIFDIKSIPYLNSLDTLSEVRKAIMLRLYPEVHSKAWLNAATIVCSLKPEVKRVQLSRFTMLFTDMWENFNESHNAFTLAMETALKSVDIRGYSRITLPQGEIPDLVIFGPFGTVYESLPNEWPKVHFTGENTNPIDSAKLNIGFHLESHEGYLRMPLWMFYIDWFGADLERIQNPMPIPIDACTMVDPESFASRTKFCAFIVTNPSNVNRNSAFFSLNSYKPVDSAGKLYNNVGDELFAGLGGGGGELKKHEFLKNYRFCIAYENSSSPGYTTEKLLHAKAAGCVPIYWGDPSVTSEFDERGFINANAFKDSFELIEAVDKLERNEDLWKQYASIPALTPESYRKARQTFSEMVKRFLQLANKSAEVPKLVGAQNSEEANTLRNRRKPIVNNLNPVISHAIPDPITNPLLVTGATQRFWPSLIKWLDSIQSHKTTVPGLNARVYVGSDVSEQSIQLTSKVYEFADFIRFPSETPSNFPDYWNPHHYAWKLWIYNTVVHDESIKGRLVFYMDCASVLVRWPLQWMKDCSVNGVSFLDDSSQKNRSWCHYNFCKALSLTEEEYMSNQIAACLLLFVAGHPLALELFSSAYKWGQIRDVITGEKWEGFDTNGNPYGHRHDQSILSILGQRINVHRVPLETVYCDKSLRATFHSTKAVYVHRGNYKTHEPYLPGIDEIFAINLDRRQDRKQSFIEHHPELKGTLRRLPAYDGRALTLGPYLAKLFKPNNFHWKKAVMGCALSHLKLLNMLVNEQSDINAYCILEDDCRLEKGWQTKWVKAYPNLPEDWDCVYLGGVLPPNRGGLSSMLERIAPGVARIAPNQMFGQGKPTRYFHFCTYAYVISRAGAKKILESIFQNDGYFTSADHMMCNPVDSMNLYLIDPLVAGASQDNDPIYQEADFNNYSRLDKFDSDLWNNDDRFSAMEVQVQQGKNAKLDIALTLLEAEGKTVEVIEESKENTKPRFVSLDICEIVNEGFYELAWLRELFAPIHVSIEPVSIDDKLDSRPLIVVVRRPKWTEQIQWLQRLCDQGKTFKVIHLSDEFLNDPIDFYNWQNITGVLRNYSRADLPDDKKILVIPLGYHWPSTGYKTFADREYMWSFAGTDWLQKRSQEMQPLSSVEPNKALWYNDWNDPKNLNEQEFMKLVGNTKCIPCPRGNNVETYRFYEALESGCIPIFIDYPTTSAWMKQFHMGKKSMNFFRIEDWSVAADLMKSFQDDPKGMEEYRQMILNAWDLFKVSLKLKIRKLMI